VLRRLPKQVSEQVLVGLETPDDAGVLRLDDERALIQTLDFFTPIVDDAYEYGQIAAANSLSDVYAMGGIPLTAMNIVCFPMESLPQEWLVDILRGGAAKVAESGAILLGGHTVNDETIKYGLSVTGIAHPARILATKGARPGDVLVLTKPLGTGIITTAIKAGTASEEEAREAIASMKRLNSAAAEAACTVGAVSHVHAATDITGFGLLGHLGEMVEYSGVAAELTSASIPFLRGALEHAREGVNTGGGVKNAQHLGARISFRDELPPEVRVCLYDPQTSGGLLFAVGADSADRLVAELERRGVEVRASVGVCTAGPPGTVRVL